MKDRTRSASSWSGFGHRALPLVLPAVLLLLWEAGSRLAWFSPVLLPPPRQIVTTFADLLKSGELLLNLRISLGGVLAGFGFGTVAGFLLGTALGVSRTAERYVGPLFHGIRQVPLYGWMPFLILWLGVGEAFKIALIAVGAFYPMVLNTFEGVRTVSDKYLEVGRVFEYGPFRLFHKVILPAALPTIFVGVRLGLGLSWMMVIGAEFVASTNGIGYLMAQSRTFLRSDVVLVCIFVVGTIGFAMDFLVRLAEARLLHWRHSTVME